MFCSLQEELVVPTLCVGGQCAEAEPLKDGSRGVAKHRLTPGPLIGSRVWPPASGRPRLRGIETNAQPAPATSPCRSAHLLFVFLGEEMVGCHVSVSGHVMPLPALVHSLGHQFASDLWRGSHAHSAHCEGPGESLAHPAHASQLRGRARRACLGMGAFGLPEPVGGQRPASSLSPQPSPTKQTRTHRDGRSR